jgi:NTE family protein
MESFIESPSRLILFFHPGDSYRGREVGRQLAMDLVQENAGPVLYFSFVKMGTGRGLHEFLKSRLEFSVEHLRTCMERSEGYDILYAGGLTTTDHKRSSQTVPMLLSLLRKYYSMVLVEADSPDYDRPYLLKLAEHADRIVFSGPGNLHQKLHQHPSFAIQEIMHDRQDRIDYFEDRPSDRPATTRLARFLSGTTRGLCLGGGGARAFAHVGVLEVFEKENLEFDFIAGSSMGAVIAAAWAMGMTSAEINELLRKHLPNRHSIFDKSLPFVSFFRGKKIEKALAEVFGDTTIESLKIPFFCTGSDLNSGKLVVYKEGLLRHALLASISLPGLFPPVRDKRKAVVDGSVLNNLPGSLLREQGAHRIIGINVTPLRDAASTRILPESNRGILKGLLDYISMPPILKIVSRSISIQGLALHRFRMEDFDLVLTPSVEGFDFFDFERRDELRLSGSKEATAHLKQVKEILGRKRLHAP